MAQQASRLNITGDPKSRKRDQQIYWIKNLIVTTVKTQNKASVNKGRFCLKTTTAKFWAFFDDAN